MRISLSAICSYSLVQAVSAVHLYLAAQQGSKMSYTHADRNGMPLRISRASLYLPNGQIHVIAGDQIEYISENVVEERASPCSLRIWMRIPYVAEWENYVAK